MTDEEYERYRKADTDYYNAMDRGCHGIIPSDPNKLPRLYDTGIQLTLEDLLDRIHAAHAYWLRMRRDETDWEFQLGDGVLEAWRGVHSGYRGGGLAFTWDFDEARWKQIT